MPIRCVHYTTSQTEYNTQLANYNSATVPAEIASFKALADHARTDMNAANDQLVLFSSVAIGVWVLNSVHAFLTGPVAEAPDTNASPIRLAFDPATKNTKLELRFDL